MAAVPCNTAHRPVVTCAHRGNAAELLANRHQRKAASVLQQMQLLWDAGVTCFDMDVVHLKGESNDIGKPGTETRRWQGETGQKGRQGKGRRKVGVEDKE